MSKYTALTIGPMYQTFSFARKTREIWAASFMFSMLMRNIIDQLEDKEKIVIPYAKDFPKLDAVGLYSDRLLYKGEIKDLNTKIDLAIDSLAELLKNGYKPKGGLKNVLKDYLQVYHFIIDEKELSNVPGSNYIARLDFILNSLELEQKIHSAGLIRDMANILKSMHKTDLYADHFKKIYSEKTKSLVEIAVADLLETSKYSEELETLIEKENDESAENGDLLDKIKECVNRHKEDGKPSPFNNYHKYVAVVQADGDKMGRLIGDVLNMGLDIHEVSETLFVWAKKASRRILAFKGMPVYAGGDDLLCFTPIVFGEKNVIDVLKEISTDFKTAFRELLEKHKDDHSKKINLENDIPTLSFGVSITFYKYPLNESLNFARDLLYEMKRKGGDGICLRMLKHSGSDFEMTLSFKAEDERFSIFNNLTQSVDMTEKLLSSTAYHLRNNLKIIDELAGKGERMESFFSNNMEGYPSQKENDSKHYLAIVEQLVNHAFQEKALDADGKYINRMLPVYDMLRLVKFLKGLEKVDE